MLYLLIEKVSSQDHHTMAPNTVGTEKEHTWPQHLAIKQAVAILYQHVSTYFRQGFLTF